MRYVGLMSIFSRKKPTAKPAPQLVSVNLRKLGPNPNINESGGYVYKWGVAQPPSVGQWVWVNANGDQMTAVVCSTTATLPTGFRLNEIKTISRLVSDRDIKRAGA